MAVAGWRQRTTLPLEGSEGALGNGTPFRCGRSRGWAGSNAVASQTPKCAIKNLASVGRSVLIAGPRFLPSPKLSRGRVL